MDMRCRFAGFALVAAGLFNAAPAPAQVSPKLFPQDYAEDGIAGSGQETGEFPIRRPQRRPTLRLRLRSDADRTALLRIIHEIPNRLGECFPECRGNEPMANLLLPLVRAVHEDRAVSVDDLAAETCLPPNLVERRLEQLKAHGLVVLTEALGPPGTRHVIGTTALRRRSTEFVDRLYYALSTAINGS
jgi:hypothetical protein